MLRFFACFAYGFYCHVKNSDRSNDFLPYAIFTWALDIFDLRTSYYVLEKPKQMLKIRRMKKFLLLQLAGLAVCGAAVAQVSPNVPAVACQGTVVPQTRISRLGAYNPAGVQTVFSEVLVKKGQLVKRGQPVAVIMGYARAKAAYDSAVAAVKSAQAQADITILRQENLIADIEGNMAQNKEVLDEKDPPRREREQIEFEQKTLARHLAQSKAMLPLVRAAQKAAVEQAEKSAAEAKANFDSYTVLSPIDGKVIDVYAKVGEAEGESGVCEISDTSKMFVDAEVYFSDVLKVKPGDKAEIFSDALKGRKFLGVVSEVSSQVKRNNVYNLDPNEYSDTRVVNVKIAVEDGGSFENLIGSQVSVRILVSDEKK